MKEKYRIAILTEKSGKKWYEAQVADPFFFYDYKTIKENGLKIGYGSIRFNNIVDAENAINERIKFLNEEDSKTIIDIKYKYL